MLRRGLLLKWTVRYGYQPLQVLWWLVVPEAAGTVALHAGQQLVARQEAPTFDAFLYTLDLLLPVVNPRQRGSWVAAAFTLAGRGLALCLAVGVGRIFEAR